MAHHLEDGGALDKFDPTEKPVYGVHKHASNATLYYFSRSKADLIDECKKEVVSAKKAALQGDVGIEMQRK